MARPVGPRNATLDKIGDLIGSVHGLPSDLSTNKKKYLKAELGEEALDAMRALKQALDPQNIFNPGKIVPAA